MEKGNKYFWNSLIRWRTHSKRLMIFPLAFQAHQDIMRWRIPKRGGPASQQLVSTATLARIAWRLGSNVFSVSVAAPDAGTASSESTAEEARGGSNRRGQETNGPSNRPISSGERESERVSERASRRASKRLSHTSNDVSRNPHPLLHRPSPLPPPPDEMYRDEMMPEAAAPSLPPSPPPASPPPWRRPGGSNLIPFFAGSFAGEENHGRNAEAAVSRQGNDWKISKEGKREKERERVFIIIYQWRFSANLLPPR